MRSLNLLFVYGAGLLLTPTSVHAVPEFPREIKRDLSLDYEPPCSVCHLKNNTGVGTAVTPFVLALRERGLEAEARTSLASSMSQLDTDKIDSDGDAMPDVEELREGTDPNSDAPVSLKDPPPEWGCSLYARPAGPRRCSIFALLALGLVLHFRFRRVRT